MATTTFPPEKRERYLELRARGWKNAQCCRELGITPGAVRYALEHHDDFADRLELIETEDIDKAEEGLATLVGQHDFRAIKFTLENLAPEKWARARQRPSRDEVDTGPAPITIAKMNVQVIAGVLQQHAETGLAFISGPLAIQPVTDAIEMPDPIRGDAEAVDAEVVDA